MTVRDVQAASGLLFGSFLALHLVNTWAAMAGPEAYEGLQAVVSAVYQAALLEGLILAALLVHVGCAVMRWRREGVGARPLRSRPLRARLHRYAGVFLLVVIAGHVAAVRIVPGWFGIRPGFDGVAFSLQFLPAYFYPYYLLLGLAGAYHGMNGAAVALTRLGVRVRLPARWLYGLAAGSGALTLLALLAFGGILFPVPDAGDSAFARLYLRLVNGGSL